jgi:basic membrane protein A
VLIIASMALSACQQAATPAPQEPAAPKIKVCQVTDTGGIDDKSFNATAWKGVEDAMKELGVEANIWNLSSKPTTKRTSTPSLKMAAT